MGGGIYGQRVRHAERDLWRALGHAPVCCSSPIRQAAQVTLPSITHHSTDDLTHQCDDADQLSQRFRVLDEGADGGAHARGIGMTRKHRKVHRLFQKLHSAESY